MLTAFIITLAVITGIISYHHNEWLLFVIGLFLELLLKWDYGILVINRSGITLHFFGVPYWLPVIWGFGFVIITRLGMFVLGV